MRKGIFTIIIATLSILSSFSYGIGGPYEEPSSLLDTDTCTDTDCPEEEPLTCNPKEGKVFNKTKTACICAGGYIKDKDGNNTDECKKPGSSDYGINCDSKQLSSGICSMNIESILNIRKSTPQTTPDEFLSDIVLTATTFVGTLLTIALIVSGLFIVFGGASEGLASKGRNGIKYALIGYVIVLCSYAIIRLVQYISQAGT